MENQMRGTCPQTLDLIFFKTLSINYGHVSILKELLKII